MQPKRPTPLPLLLEVTADFSCKKIVQVLASTDTKRDSLSSVRRELPVARYHNLL